LWDAVGSCFFQFESCKTVFGGLRVRLLEGHT
jgi:hypothetical protein